MARIDLPLALDAAGEKLLAARPKFLDEFRHESAGVGRENLRIASVQRSGNFKSADERHGHAEESAGQGARAKLNETAASPMIE
jgi:hypothetical protein